MNENVLHVWLYGNHLGEHERLRSGQLRLRFDTQAIAIYGEGSPVLSLSLPLSSRRVEGRRLDTFVQGLLPEMLMRAMIEDANGVPRNDDFALLSAIGAERAGAVQFLAAGRSPGDGELRALSPAEVNEIVQALPTLEPPGSLPVTASLGGIQSKVLLTAVGPRPIMDGEDQWAWPAYGAISTHIIKPEANTNIVVQHLIESEYWALKLARASGLSAATEVLRDFGGRNAIVVERYDRVGGRRAHQEDFAQALGLGVLDKYERSGRSPSRLTRLATEAGSASLDAAALQGALLRMVTFNAIIGNSDAHSKNYSLLISDIGNVRLAPLYDVAPTMLLNRNLTTAGHALDG